MKDLLIKECKEKMDKALKAMDHHFDTLRTGRASLGLLDDVTVEAYGSPTPLNQVASLSTPDAKTIAIQPWDKSVIGAIERAILAANIGITPNNDGSIIRLSIPPMTEERRRDVAKMAHKMGEDARVAIRNVRRHINDSLKKGEKDGDISEDEHKHLQKEVQKLTDDHIKLIDEAVQAKEKEIMEV